MDEAIDPGRQRVAALVARVLGSSGPADAGMRAWLAAFPAEGALGLDPAGLDAATIDALGWAGVPLARGGVLRVGRDLLPAAVDAPRADGDAVLLPPPAALRACTSLALKPLRALVARRCGVRLQTGPGVYLFLWPDRAALVSCASVPLAGFLHGPATGQRESVALEPGECQVIAW